MTDQNPVEALLRLPEWCVYIETPGLHVQGVPKPFHGFWVYVDAVNERDAKLALVGDIDGDFSLSFSFDLI